MYVCVCDTLNIPHYHNTLSKHPFLFYDHSPLGNAMQNLFLCSEVPHLLTTIRIAYRASVANAKRSNLKLIGYIRKHTLLFSRA